MPRKVLTLLRALVVIFALAALTVLVSSTGRTPPRPPLPNPNAYDDFLKAAALLSGDVDNGSRLHQDDLRALVSANSESLRLLRLGLTRGCSVPIDSAMTNVAGVLGDLADLVSLALLLEQEGRLAEMENRNGDAAHSYLDVIRFGNEMSRGGGILNRDVGIACETIGRSSLVKLATKLERDDALSVITALEKVDSVRVTWDEVRRNEDRFSRYQHRKSNPIAWATTEWQHLRSMQQGEARHKRVIALERLLTAELGLHCYAFEQGRVPTGLGELVPQDLQRVPSDPFSGRPVIYRSRGTNWLLYSVGEDGVDDGGKQVGGLASGTVTGGDLFWDSAY